MSINNITNLNQYATTQMIKTQVANQAKTTAVATAKTADTTKTNTQNNKQVAFDDIAGRIANIPNLEKYEDVIQRFISGESEMESADKPLTDDQIALRQLMREYGRTNTQSMSQIAGSMKQASKNFMDYWFSSGNKGPMPGRILSADGSFKIFNSKAEKDEYMKNQKMNFLKSVMSVINTQKNDSANKDKSLDMRV